MHRWRLDETSLDLTILPHNTIGTERPDQSSSQPSGPSDDKQRPWTPSEQSAPQIWFPLPYDNLLHLVEFNVLRGLLQNKYMVDYLTIPCQVPDPHSQTFISNPAVLRYSTILPVHPECSGSLAPTLLQMSVNHFSWIDCFPCPVMRENIIRHEFEFSHADFVKDLVGSLMNLQIFYQPPSLSRSDPASIDMTAQTGLIIWGEPFLVSSWEMTPGFIRKWGWMVRNCYELLDSTNQWRELRGEGPLSSADNSAFKVTGQVTGMIGS